MALSPFVVSDVEKSLIDAVSESKRDVLEYSIWVEMLKGKKGDKVDRLVASVGKFRLYLFKVSKKKAESVLELKYVTFKTVEVVEKELKITDVSGGSTCIQTDSPLELANRIKGRLSCFFPDNYGQIVEFKTGGSYVPDPERLPCGNLSVAYLAMCDLEGCPPREDIVWDIEQIFGSRKTREFSFNSFTLPISDKDLRNLLLALKFNPHFTSLELDGSDDGIPIEKELVTVGDLFRHNTTLTSIKFVHIKGDEKIWLHLFTQLQQNTSSELCSIEFDDCSWECSSKSIAAVAGWIGSLTRKGLDECTLKNTGSSTRKIASIFEAISKSSVSSLTKLDLENLKMDSSSLDKLAEFIGEASSLTDLNVGNVGISLPPLFNALFEKKIPIKTLNISGNRLKKKQTIQPILDYLMNCSQLESLDISSVELNIQDLEKFLIGLSGNKGLPKCFGLSVNNVKLEKEGGEVIARALTGNVRRLSMKSCELGDEGLRIVLKGISAICGLEELDLSLNLKHPRGPGDRERELTVVAIGEFLDLRGNCLETFKLSGQRGSEVGPYLDVLFKKLAVGENVNLTSLDVSGNNAGDDGASALAKYLEKTRVLRHLSYDRNGTSARGLQWLRNGLMKNESLLSFEAPLLDVSAAGEPDKIRTAVGYWKDIEDLLRKRLPVKPTNLPEPAEDEKKKLHKRRKSRVVDAPLRLDNVGNVMNKSNPASPRKTPKSPRVAMVTSSSQAQRDRELPPLVSPRMSNLRSSRDSMKEEKGKEDKSSLMDDEKTSESVGLASSSRSAASAPKKTYSTPHPVVVVAPTPTPTPTPPSPVSEPQPALSFPTTVPLANVSRPKGPARRPPGRPTQKESND